MNDIFLCSKSSIYLIPLSYLLTFTCHNINRYHGYLSISYTFDVRTFSGYKILGNYFFNERDVHRRGKE